MNIRVFANRSWVIFLLVFLSFNQVWAGKYHEIRPKIKNLEAREHPELERQDPEWKSLKEAHIETVAELFGMYPGYHIFFLARDGELLYDTAKEISRLTGRIEDEKRAHLINVSRVNQRDVNLKRYLKSKGISERELDQGRKVLFIDSGFYGSIPLRIMSLFPDRYRNQFRLQLLCSTQVKSPSTRVFLCAFKPGVNTINPRKFVEEIGRYERRARATHRSTHYVSTLVNLKDVDGKQKFKVKWTPYVPDSTSEPDGIVDFDQAKKDMEDLKAYLNQKEVQDHYRHRRRFWDDLHLALDRENAEEVQEILKKTINSQDPKKDHLIGDAYEIVEKNIRSKKDLLISLEGLENSKDPVVGAPKVETKVSGPYSNLCVVKYQLDRLIQETKKPEEILLVLDDEEPLIFEENSISSEMKLIKRPCAQEILSTAQDQKSYLVVTKSHPEFGEDFDPEKIKTVILVGDMSHHQSHFLKEMREIVHSLPELKRLELISLNSLKKSQFKKGYFEAAKKGPLFQSLYQESYSRVAPALMGAVDRFLRSAEDEQTIDVRKFYFLARDGLSGYEIAKILITRFPDRYPDLTLDRIQYVHLNKNTIHSDNVVDYFSQTGVLPQEKIYFFDLGWYGSLTPNLKDLVQKVRAQFGGVYLVFAPLLSRPEIEKYLPFQSGLAKHPFGSVAGNVAVHFMEDTFSGIERRSSQLLKGESGMIFPESLGKFYEAEIRTKREVALQALRDAAEDLDSKNLEELNTLHPEVTQSVLYPFLNRLKTNESGIQAIMVPHER